jgi:hypothetical protein
MAARDDMGLKKLTIKAYKAGTRESGQLIGTFEAMFNPTSFSQKYENLYGDRQALNSTDGEKRYTFSMPRELSLQLILDGTGVHRAGLAGSQPTVSERVKNFLYLTYHMKGKSHEPTFLLVEWGGQEDGGLNLECRLVRVNVNYTSFTRDGAPLRAELDVVFISDEEPTKRVAKEGKQSPDLTHMRIVKSGDTLPLLTKEVYGSSHLYLRVAQTNNLDDFRNLTPGQELYFPPLERSS